SPDAPPVINAVLPGICIPTSRSCVERGFQPAPTAVEPAWSCHRTQRHARSKAVMAARKGCSRRLCGDRQELLKLAVGRSKSEAPLGEQRKSLPDGPGDTHLARAALQVISEDQWRFSKNHIQFAKLQQDVHHALKSIRLDELAAVPGCGGCQNSATIRTETAG